LEGRWLRRRERPAATDGRTLAPPQPDPVAGVGTAAERRPPLFTRDYLLLWVGNFGVFVAFHLWTPVLPFYIFAAGGDNGDVGLIGAMLSAGSLPARLVSGPLLDRRRRKPILFAGGLIFALAIALHPLAHTVPFLAATRMLLGVGFACFTGAALALIADLVPRERRGEGLALYSMSSNVAQAGAPALASALFALGGFNPVAILAALATLATVISTGLCREPPPAGAPTPVSATADPPEPAGVRRHAPSWRSFLVREALLPSALILFIYGCLGAVLNFIPLYARALDLPSAGLYFAINASAVVLARLTTGRISDRFGRQAVVLPCVGLMVVALALLALAPYPATYLLAALLFGFGFGAGQPALVAFIVDRAPLARRGAAMGTYLIATDVGTIIFLPLLGQLAPHTGYPGLYGVAALALAAALAGYTAGLARQL